MSLVVSFVHILRKCFLSSSSLYAYFILMDLTCLICWNCKGLLGRDTTTHIFALIKKYNHVICYLVETRADSSRLDRFAMKIRHN